MDSLYTKGSLQRLLKVNQTLIPTLDIFPMLKTYFFYELLTIHLLS
jgi:hypothetical protein